MRKHLVFVGVLAIALSLPLSALDAASKRPTVTIVEPEKNEQLDRKGKMPVILEFENIDRPMVVEITTKLVKQDRSSFPVGFVGGGTYQFTVYAGQTDYEFVIDWGLNDTIPGKYSIIAQLKACNKFSCDTAPAGKALSKKSKKVNFSLTNSSAWAPTVAANSNTWITLTRPNGGEEYYAGSGESLKISWVAENVPPKSTVLVYLIRQGAGGNFSFPGDGKPKKAKNGKDSITAKLIRTPGYDLGPGEYWAKVAILAPDPKTGKDAPTLAEDISDDTFTLRSLSY